MFKRILGLAGGRRRRLLLGAMVSAVALGAFLITSAFAVHDETFQLEGDVSASTTTNVGGSTQTLDWDSLFDANGDNKAFPAGFTAAKFTRDFLTNANGSFNTSDDTTYATGSKDTLPIATGWECNHDSNVNSKIDIMNAYAGAYTSPSGEQIIYFALERNSNAGDGNVAFWFLQDTVGCSAPSGHLPFSGDHRDGDLLIVSAFTNGGSVSNVSVYRWNGGANGSLGTTPAAIGGDCKTQLTGSNDKACATVNSTAQGTGGTITTPWLTANKQDGVGHSLRTSEFFEGAVNLSRTNLAGKCFNVFIGDTRSSQSLTATLFDFARGLIGECTSKTETSPVSASSAGTTDDPPASSIPTDPNDAKVEVKDKTVLTVNGVSSFSGTLSWHICGPTASNSTALCGTGGVDAGSQSVTAAGTYYSPKVTVTAAGRYCFRADFSGDSSIGVPGSSDSRSTECFVVAPATPTIATQAGAGPVDFGNPVTDTASLTGTAHKPGTGGPSGSDGSINPTTLGGDATGTITFTLYKSDCTTPATGTGTNPQTVNVSGDGTYGPVSFTPDAPGTYHWVATYGGDSPNTNASPASNSQCPDENEDVIVRQIPTRMKTAQFAFPNDSTRVESTAPGENLPSGGTIVFRLYGATTGGNSALVNCQAHGNTLGSGGLLYRESFTVGDGAHDFVTASTTNYPPDADAVSVNTNDTVYWRVTYAPPGTKFTGRQSDCVENTSFTFANDDFPGTLFP